jgi:hypothetical protein
LAQRLVLDPAAGPKNPDVPPDYSFAALEKLERQLHLAVGGAGSNALLSRALVLAKKDLPRLAGVSLNKKNRLEGLANIDPPFTQEEAYEGEIHLIGNTVELLCTFVGKAMALRFIQSPWPDASFDKEEVDEDSLTEGTNEQSVQSDYQ